MLDFTRDTLDEGSSSQAAKHAAKCGRLSQLLVGGLPDLRQAWFSGAIGSRYDAHNDLFGLAGI
jgi:hypothetical protein